MDRFVLRTSKKKESTGNPKNSLQSLHNVPDSLDDPQPGTSRSTDEQSVDSSVDLSEIIAKRYVVESESENDDLCLSEILDESQDSHPHFSGCEPIIKKKEIWTKIQGRVANPI
ncbi:uncharacterized protein [Leptinotarsa decemlineata]|uniref:uncharacterized protein n=1 Tax=Leptinotarsa decemlineata TaxID=7539 RepID=UPI003D3087FD